MTNNNEYEAGNIERAVGEEVARKRNEKVEISLAFYETIQLFQTTLHKQDENKYFTLWQMCEEEVVERWIEEATNKVMNQ
tara:strand:- start:1394 stop:1633 length:240 start_codon:yes stop_codon:yes gene_type:complete